MVMLMTTLSAGAYGGGVASGVARAVGAGRVQDATRLAGTASDFIRPSRPGDHGDDVGLREVDLRGARVPAARPWTRPSSIRMSSSSGRSRSGCSPPPPASSAGAATRPTRRWPVRSGASSRWRRRRSSSSGRAGARLRDRRGGVGGRRLQRGPRLRAVACGTWAAVGGAADVPVARSASAVRGGDPRVAVPSAASTLLTNLTFILLTGLVAPFGTEAIAGYGAGGRLEYLLIPIVFGVGSALVPLVAASDGAGDFARVRRSSPRRGGAGGGGVRARGHRRGVLPRCLDGAVHFRRRGGRGRHLLPHEGRAGVRLPRAGPRPVLRGPGARADHATAPCHADAAAGRRRRRVGDGRHCTAGASTPCSL